MVELGIGREVLEVRPVTHPATLGTVPLPSAGCAVSAPTPLAQVAGLAKSLIHWSGRPGSNRRPSAPKADTLPLRYAPEGGIIPCGTAANPRAHAWITP